MAAALRTYGGNHLPEVNEWLAGEAGVPDGDHDTAVTSAWSSGES